MHSINQRRIFTAQFSVFIFIFFLFLIPPIVQAQPTVFEKTNGTESATYFQAIDYYRQLDKVSPKLLMKTMGITDAGYPLHLVLLSADEQFNPAEWHQQKKVVILIINGIHAGEPDGIDASMMLARDIINNKVALPKKVALSIIPVYNIGGSLNRNSTSRVNQNGPKEYGFRGNAQNLDLNRDFTKNDSRNARSFAEIFHWLDPDIQIDNHVSDGADYQYTMTMLTTQADKLGDDLGEWLRSSFEPSLYKSMAEKGWEMTPYVNFEATDFKKGMQAFYDPPRYSSGYAALWQTIGFTPETHMLKPYKDRVKSTWAFMKTVIEEAGKQSGQLISLRNKLKQATAATKRFPLWWQVDTTRKTSIDFKGYEPAYKTSEVTGMQRLYYDRDRPFNRPIAYYNYFAPTNWVEAPDYYLVPQGWQDVVERLKFNKVKMIPLKSDSSLTLDVIKIKSYKTSPTPYEKHYRKSNIEFDTIRQTMRFLKGDYLVPVNQRANRFIVEMLEPAGADSYFAWNFFDGILQQKEGYSDYRWEDLAAEVLRKNPALQADFDAKKNADKAFADDAGAQLNWVYKHSQYYEAGHNRYPVYRLYK